MKELNQQIIKFGYDKNFKNEDFYISLATNIFLICLIMAEMGKKFLNISGEKFSGKTT